MAGYIRPKHTSLTLFINIFQECLLHCAHSMSTHYLTYGRLMFSNFWKIYTPTTLFGSRKYKVSGRKNFQSSNPNNLNLSYFQFDIFTIPSKITGYNKRGFFEKDKINYILLGFLLNFFVFNLMYTSEQVWIPYSYNIKHGIQCSINI